MIAGKRFVTEEINMKRRDILVLVVLCGMVFGCAQSGPAAKKTESPPAAVSGTYTGTAEGYGGAVEVTLEIKDGAIVSASAAGAGETPQIGGLALDLMPGMMVSANSIEVDVISGATITSQAVLDAAVKALEKAGITNADLKR
jgi:fumarate reductase flavoprotein subunit